MNRFTCFALLLPLSMTPAFSAVDTKLSPHSSSAAKRHVKTHPGVRKHTVVQANHSKSPVHQAAESPKSVPLTGRLIYQEVLPAATPTAPVTEDDLDLRAETKTNSLERSQATTTQVDVKTYPPATHAHGFTWTNFLKLLSLDWAPHRVNPGIRERSWVCDVTQEQSLQLADWIAAYITKQAPTESTILLLAPPPRAQASNPLTLALSDSLRRSGFGIVESKRQAPDAQVLRYQVSRLNGGLWVQLQLNQTEANRFYSVNVSNSLVAEAPLSVREVR